MNKFKYEKLFQFNKDNTKYTKLNTDPIKIKKIDGKEIIIITKTKIHLKINIFINSFNNFII